MNFMHIINDDFIKSTKFVSFFPSFSRLCREPGLCVLLLVIIVLSGRQFEECFSG